MANFGVQEGTGGGSDEEPENSSSSSTNDNSKPNNFNPDTDTIMSIFRTETIINKDGTMNSVSRIVTSKTDTIKKSEVKDFNWSPYNYVLGNPVKFIDLNGKAPGDPPYSINDGKLIGNNVTHDITDITKRERMKSINGIVLHRADGSTAEGAINTTKGNKGKTGFHIVIETDGSITQINNLENRANHVGKSKGDIDNFNSIGIEVVGKHTGSPGENKWDPLTPLQIESVAQALSAIMSRYELGLNDIYPHEDVSFKTPGEGQTVLDAVRKRLTELRNQIPTDIPPIDSSLEGLDSDEVIN